MLQKTDARTLRLLDFAEFIESLPDDRIDLKGWCHTCGTVACYAGHAILKYGTPDQREQMMFFSRRKLDPLETARGLLSLNDLQAKEIFLSRWLPKCDAVMLLRKWAFEEPQT